MLKIANKYNATYKTDTKLPSNKGSLARTGLANRIRDGLAQPIGPLVDGIADYENGNVLIEHAQTNKF